MFLLKLKRRRPSLCQIRTSGYTVVMMGSPKTGKTSLISRFLNKKKTPEYSPTIEDMHHGTLDVNDKQCVLNILDTCGTNDFPAMRQLSITKADVFILVFSWRDQASLDEVPRLKAQIVKERGSAGRILVVATNMPGEGGRNDHVRMDKNITEAIVTFDWGLSFFDASSLDDASIKEVFVNAVLLCGKRERKRSDTI